jgi:osmotically-inducible protein OsmY
MRSDVDIKRDVEDELRSDPDIDATDIAVAVKDGVAMLTGFVRSFRQKRKAEEDVKRVAGVIGVANNIEVRLPIIHRRPDPDIARDVVGEIQNELPLSWEKIRVSVEDGWVTLEGEVEWHYQRERAQEAVWRARGARECQQYHSDPVPSPSGRHQTQDRGGLAKGRRDRCESHHGRGPRRRNHLAGSSPIVGRARGGRASGMARARCHQSG